MRIPFSSTSTSLSPKPRSTGRAAAEPLRRTLTPGRSPSFSANDDPPEFWNSIIPLDATDW